MASKAIVIWLAEDSQRKRHRFDAEFGCTLFDEPLTAAWAKCGQSVLARGRVINLLGAARHSDERFYFVVVRRQIFVGDRPVFAKSVLQTLGLEIQRSKAPRLSTPHQGSPAHRAKSCPGKFRAWS